MRASEREQIGAAGETAVTGAFEGLGWGVVANTRHDLGTDLFVQARDERRFDLGLLVGVQVKTGKSWFKKPKKGADAALLGWWFRDKDREHVDAWVRHGLPHLLVLHDLHTDTSYWVHVTAEVVKTTGKGVKVLVPASQTLTEDHRAALLAVAATPRRQVAWEGSVWTGAGLLLPADRLRHALVVPRVVAPHPNAGHTAVLSAPQAVALLMQGRGLDLAAFAQRHPEVPTVAQARQSPHWEWRFVGALGHRLGTEEVDVLLEVIDDAPDAASRIAAVVTAAAALMENDRVDQAVDLLHGELERDQADPVDHAWLTAQHARACAQIGRIAQARAGALDVQRVRISHPDDVTATAIAGVAAALLWDTSAWGHENLNRALTGTDTAHEDFDQTLTGIDTAPPETAAPDADTGHQDLGRALTGTDTAAAWWRAQNLSRGLQAATTRTYNAWARDTTVTWSASDVANNELFTASLTANHLGDHAGWRHAFALLGKDALTRLDRHADPQQVQAGLNTLRLAGDTKALTLAVRRLVTDGPATAVTLAAAEVDLTTSTRTTGPTDLALLRHGGDVLEEQVADRSIAWLLTTLDDPSVFTARTTPSYWLELELINTLARVVPAASPSARGAVVEHLAALPSQQDQLLARSWGRVVHALPDSTWSEPVVSRVNGNDETHVDELRLPLLGVAAQVNPTVKTDLAEQVRAGSLDALHAYGNLTTLPTEVAGAAVHHLVDRVTKRIDDAVQGSFPGGGPDIGQALTVLNAWHPEVAAWKPLLDLIGHPVVGGWDKRGALHVLAALVERIPAEVRERLAQIAAALADQPSPMHGLPLLGPSQVTGPAAELLAALSTLEPNHDRLLALLGGDVDDRKSAARAAAYSGCSEDVGVLQVLTQDAEPQVRAAASAGLAFLVGAGRGGPRADAGLRRCVRDPGTQVLIAVASTLADLPECPPTCQEILASLRNHLSARVREFAASV